MGIQPKRRRVARLFSVVAVAGFTVAAGCKKHYVVTDLSTAEIYYTDHLNEENEPLSGVLQFVDESTGAVISLDEYAYRKIGKKAFRRGIADARDQ